MTDLTTPDTAGLTGNLPRLQALAADTRARLDAHWQAEQIERDSQERNAAVSAADTFVQRTFPNTLAQILNAPSWIGYRSLDALQDGTETLASAIAYLGAGVFVRHVAAPSLVPLGGPFDVLTLWFACGCGNYIGAVIGEEYDLADVLADLDHSVCAGACEPSTGPHDSDDSYEDFDEDYEGEGPQIEDVIADLAHYSAPRGVAS